MKKKRETRKENITLKREIHYIQGSKRLRGRGEHSRVPLKLHPLFSASSLVERLSGQSSPQPITTQIQHKALDECYFSEALQFFPRVFVGLWVENTAYYNNPLCLQRYSHYQIENLDKLCFVASWYIAGIFHTVMTPH